MEKIVFNKRVITQLNDIVFILFEQEYFSFLESATDYRDNILNHITVTNLKLASKSPENLSLGEYYIKVKANYRTMWYIFFDKTNDTFYIEHIINNHLPQAQYLNNL